MEDASFIADYLHSRGYPPTEENRKRVQENLALYPDINRTPEDRTPFLDRTMGNRKL